MDRRKVGARYLVVRLACNDGGTHDHIGRGQIGKRTAQRSVIHDVMAAIEGRECGDAANLPGPHRLCRGARQVANRGDGLLPVRRVFRDAYGNIAQDAAAAPNSTRQHGHTKAIANKAPTAARSTVPRSFARMWNRSASPKLTSSNSATRRFS